MTSDDRVLRTQAQRAIDREGEDGQCRPAETQATILIQLARDVDLFHTPLHDTFATIPVHDHRETWPVHSSSFRRWLTWCFYAAQGKPPGNQAVQDALNHLDAVAEIEGPTRDVWLRLAEHDGRIYLDLTNDAWQVVEITADGWQIIEASAAPVRFRRAKAMLSLPQPERGGSLQELRRFINVGDDDWPLIVAWLVAALRPTGPYPVLALHGEHGAAKSSVAWVLRSVADPNSSPLRGQPDSERDLMIAANNSWALTFDNLSSLPVWLSDVLCRLSTGGGIAPRELYSNHEETILDAKRPIILTGITEVATRPDLLDRIVIIHLPRIPDEDRQTETEFRAAFASVRPRILGALLDAVSAAIRNLPATRLDRKPRMADFALWATAAEPGLGLGDGAFMKAYGSNREDVNDLALEASPVAAVLRDLAATWGEDGWYGTAGELLDSLTNRLPEEKRRARDWPKNGRALSGILRRLAPNLRAVRVDVQFERQSDKRGISIKNLPQSSVISVMTVIPGTTDVTQTPPTMTQDPGHGAVASWDRVPSSYRRDANDGHDAKLPTLSNGSLHGHDPERDRLRELGRTLGWPSLPFAQGMAVNAGQPAWATFVGNNPPERITLALKKAEAMLSTLDGDHGA